MCAKTVWTLTSISTLHTVHVVLSSTLKYKVYSANVYAVVFMHSLHCALSLAAQCIVITPVCGFLAVSVCFCYHDNSKLRASIFTEPGL